MRREGKGEARYDIVFFPRSARPLSRPSPTCVRLIQHNLPTTPKYSMQSLPYPAQHSASASARRCTGQRATFARGKPSCPALPLFSPLPPPFTPRSREHAPSSHRPKRSHTIPTGTKPSLLHLGLVHFREKNFSWFLFVFILHTSYDDLNFFLVFFFFFFF